MPDWKDKKVLVLGLGDTGLSMTRWLARHGALVSAADSRSAPPHARTLAEELPQVEVAAGELSPRLFASADAIAISPGVDRREPAVADALRRGVPVVGDIEIFANALADLTSRGAMRQPRVVAITGSNGKSTVTAMAGEAADAAGLRTLVAGNIGLPVLDALTAIESGNAPPEVVVLELSSFQLESTASLAADAATVLNVTEDHLDRYDSMDAYAAAKSRIFQGAGAQVLNRGDRRTMSMAIAGRDVFTFGADAPRDEREWGIADGELMRGDDRLMAAADLRVTGLHNAVNALAALALGDAIGIPTAPMLDGLRRFRGLPHRLAKVIEIRGVAFYDDSKGTNVGATVAALNGMSARVVLVAGGEGKGQDFSPLAPAVKARARAVVLIGRDAGRIESALGACGVPITRCGTLDEAITAAYRAALPGDVVLLSPACASFDMFSSYVDRGRKFAEGVRALAAREGHDA